MQIGVCPSRRHRISRVAKKKNARFITLAVCVRRTSHRTEKAKGDHLFSRKAATGSFFRVCSRNWPLNGDKTFRIITHTHTHAENLRYPLDISNVNARVFHA